MAEILVVDDMAGVQRAIDALLRQAGHKVAVATNGAEAIELLTQRRFDLVVVDILMPKLDGTEVIFHLSAQPNHPPIIAMSGGGAGLSASEALRAARLKADAFLEKPFDKDQFLSLVEKLLAKSQL
jgi:CheY-like chemotaxis protein